MVFVVEQRTITSREVRQVQLGYPCRVPIGSAGVVRDGHESPGQTHRAGSHAQVTAAVEKSEGSSGRADTDGQDQQKNTREIGWGR